MNARQQKLTDQLLESIKRDRKVGQGRYEVKKQEITESDNGLVFILIETGMVDDEGTYAAIFVRDRRHIALTPRGGIELLNAKRKRTNRGFRNAVHSLTH